MNSCHSSVMRERWAHWYWGAGAVEASWLQERPACWQAGRHTVAVGGGGENPQGVNIQIQWTFNVLYSAFSSLAAPVSAFIPPLSLSLSFTSFLSFHEAGREPPSKVLTVFQRLNPERDSSLKNHTEMAFIQNTWSPYFPLITEKKFADWMQVC